MPDPKVATTQKTSEEISLAGVWKAIQQQYAKVSASLHFEAKDPDDGIVPAGTKKKAPVASSQAADDPIVAAGTKQATTKPSTAEPVYHLPTTPQRNQIHEVVKNYREFYNPEKLKGVSVQDLLKGSADLRHQMAGMTARDFEEFTRDFREYTGYGPIEHLTRALCQASNVSPENWEQLCRDKGQLMRAGLDNSPLATLMEERRRMADQIYGRRIVDAGMLIDFHRVGLDLNQVKGKPKSDQALRGQLNVPLGRGERDQAAKEHAFNRKLEFYDDWVGDRDTSLAEILRNRGIDHSIQTHAYSLKELLSSVVKDPQMPIEQKRDALQKILSEAGKREPDAIRRASVLYYHEERGHLTDKIQEIFGDQYQKIAQPLLYPR